MLRGTSAIGLCALLFVFSVFAEARAPISVSYSSLFYDFQGTRASRDNSYAFRDVTLVRHNVGASYVLSPAWHMNLSTSISRNYAETYLGFAGVLDRSHLYRDHTEGLNDTQVNAQYIKMYSRGWLVMPEFGLSLPTGSVAEKNANNRQYNYPYNMQLGSGTFDVPLAVTAMRVGSSWVPYARAQWIKRLGRNAQDYRLGDEYIGLAGLEYARRPWLVPGVRALYRDRDAIVGQDKTFGRNALVEYYHHHQINWDVSAVLKSAFAVSIDPEVKLALEAGLPLAQGLRNYDGVIVDTQFYGMLNVTGRF